MHHYEGKKVTGSFGVDSHAGSVILPAWERCSPSLGVFAWRPSDINECIRKAACLGNMQPFLYSSTQKEPFCYLMLSVLISQVAAAEEVLVYRKATYFVPAGMEAVLVMKFQSLPVGH